MILLYADIITESSAHPSYCRIKPRAILVTFSPGIRHFLVRGLSASPPIVRRDSTRRLTLSPYCIQFTRSRADRVSRAAERTEFSAERLFIEPQSTVPNPAITSRRPLEDGSSEPAKEAPRLLSHDIPGPHESANIYDKGHHHVAIAEIASQNATILNWQGEGPKQLYPDFVFGDLQCSEETRCADSRRQ